MGAPLDAPRLMAGDAHAAGLRIGRTLRQLHAALDTLPDPPDVRDCHLDEHILTWAMPRAENICPPDSRLILRIMSAVCRACAGG